MSLPFSSVDSGTEDGLPTAAPLASGRRVVVSYESSAHGRVALFHALELARRAQAPLTVVSVVDKEPVVGCARCRHSAVIWNRELRHLAEEDLAEAAGLVGTAPDIDYTIAVGDPVHALGETAARSGASAIVLPWNRRRRLRRLFASTLAERLRRPGRWEVVVAPATTRPDGQRSHARVPSGAAEPDQA